MMMCKRENNNGNCSICFMNVIDITSLDLL